MDHETNSNNRALVVHQDESDAVLRESETAPANEIVLDALPYVEPLDPNYENYAIQLIEQELQNDAGGVGGEHPSLQALLAPVSSRRGTTNFGATDLSIQCPQFGGKAPMAVASYEAIVARKSNPDRNDDNNTNTWINNNRLDPMAHQNFDQVQDKSKLIADLRTSIVSQKIALEHQRHRLINLELQQTFQTPQTYTHYNTNQLESQIVNPLQQTVERQRMEVDAINATRMEEQQRAMGTLDGLSRKYYELIDKNLRLGEAVAGLEGEVEGLKKESGASVVVDES